MLQDDSSLQATCKNCKKEFFFDVTNIDHMSFHGQFFVSYDWCKPCRRAGRKGFAFALGILLSLGCIWVGLSWLGVI